MGNSEKLSKSSRFLSEQTFLKKTSRENSKISK